MRRFLFLAAAAVILSAASPSLAQNVARIDVPPAGQQWVDNPALAPAVTDPATRARMNAEIVAAIAQANGDQDRARAAIAAIAARYQEAASPQGARTRPGPK